MTPNLTSCKRPSSQGGLLRGEDSTGLMACGAGLSVASLYYIQPMLPLVSSEMGLDLRAAGLLPAVTQLGYMLGLFLLVPLGDSTDRRRIVLAKLSVLSLSLVLAAMAPDSASLMAACFAIGLCATAAQDLVPMAAALATDENRGRLLGRVMTGLLLGILLSRVVSGVVAQALAWRWTFWAAALAVALLVGTLWQRLPPPAPSARLPYMRLMRSLRQLWLDHPTLRLAAWAQCVMSIGFGAFWSTLAQHLHGTFHLGAASAGAFGLVGIAGALAAPVVGRCIDRRGARTVLRGAGALAMVSFALMLLLPQGAPPAQLALLVLCATGLDLGGQSALMAHQSIVQGLDDTARSRLNSVLYCCMYAGIVAGSALGAVVLARCGWQGLVMFALAALAAGLGLRAWGAIPALRCSRQQGRLVVSLS